MINVVRSNKLMITQQVNLSIVPRSLDQIREFSEGYEGGPTIEIRRGGDLGIANQTNLVARLELFSETQQTRGSKNTEKRAIGVRMGYALLVLHINKDIPNYGVSDDPGLNHPYYSFKPGQTGGYLGGYFFQINQEEQTLMVSEKGDTVSVTISIPIKEIIEME